MVVWWSTPIECTSALARAERAGRLQPAQVVTALDRMGLLSEAWVEVAASEPLRTVARRLLRVHPLAAADALQLAAAIIASDREPSTLDVVCQDLRLADAATREGFRVWTI